MPWPVTFYFTEAVHEDDATVFICEGSEHGAAVGPGQEALDAEQSIRAAEHWRDYRDAYEQMAAYLCWPTPENRRTLPRSMPVGSFGGDVAAAPTRIAYACVMRTERTWLVRDAATGRMSNSKQNCS